MLNKFSPKEVVQVAVDVEENGRALYENLEKKAKDKQVKDTWRFLKEQEELHKKVFSEMLDSIDEYVAKEFSSDTYLNYMKAVASSYIFTPQLIAKKIKEGFSSDSDALDFAIGLEKESILTYYELQKFVVSGKQAIINKVIDEERKHLVELTSLRDKIGPRINNI